MLPTQRLSDHITHNSQCTNKNHNKKKSETTIMNKYQCNPNVLFQRHIHCYLRLKIFLNGSSLIHISTFGLDWINEYLRCQGTFQMRGHLNIAFSYILLKNRLKHKNNSKQKSWCNIFYNHYHKTGLYSK